MAYISFILSSKINKVDFESLEDFFKQGTIVSGKSIIEIIKNIFYEIW